MKPPRILFVDDEEGITAAYGILLKRWGYDVAAETSPMKALEYFKNDPASFDLVITDLDMPEMKGDILIEELYAVRNDIPAILITGYPEKIVEQRIQDLGIKAFLIKPLRPNVLAETVKNILSEK